MARILFITGKVKDDRGQRFSLRKRIAPHPDSLIAIIARRLGSQRTLTDDEIVRSAVIRRALLRGWPGRARYKRWRLCLAVLVILAGVAAAFMSSDPAPYVFALAICAVVLPLYLRQFRRWEARLPSLPNVCIVCIYDLTGIEPEHDGCTVCPECGGAWDLALWDST